MSEPFLAEIRIIGTTYGGDGRTSFALLELRDKTPVHKGDNYNLGQRGGHEMVTLTTSDIATHAYSLKATSNTCEERNPLEAAMLALKSYFLFLMFFLVSFF